uniref:Retrotransposon protein, putative, Ty3-gypsy sub-class n=1 Tax=Oryza sativa subsp. japonica TaxID=39947 RepID=Q84MF3_ORYSJ|nr:retrotransposon protein, putative, Ty3-gypsy sub-class [Oryza sativa Japonica Group]
MAGAAVAAIISRTAAKLQNWPKSAPAESTQKPSTGASEARVGEGEVAKLAGELENTGSADDGHADAAAAAVDLAMAVLGGRLADSEGGAIGFGGGGDELLVQSGAAMDMTRHNACLAVTPRNSRTRISKLNAILDGSDETNFNRTAPTRKIFSSGVGGKESKTKYYPLADVSKGRGGADMRAPRVSGSKGGEVAPGGWAPPGGGSKGRRGRRRPGSAQLQVGRPVMASSGGGAHTATGDVKRRRRPKAAAHTGEERKREERGASPVSTATGAEDERRRRPGDD